MEYRELISKIKCGIFDYETLRSKFPYEKDRNLIMQMHRLVRSGELIRVKRGVYLFPSIYANPRVIAAMCEPTCYMTGRGLLEELGVLEVSKRDEVFRQEVVINHISTKAIRDIKIGRYKYKFSRIKSELYFGYTKKFDHSQRGYYRRATTEKAILDFLYLDPAANELVFEININKAKRFNEKRILKQAQKYPPRVLGYLREIL